MLGLTLVMCHLPIVAAWSPQFIFIFWLSIPRVRISFKKNVMMKHFLTVHTCPANSCFGQKYVSF